MKVPLLLATHTVVLSSSESVRAAPPARRAMPQALLRVVGQLSEMAAAVTGKMPQITPAAVAMTCHHLKVDSGKAIAQLGYRETPLPQLMADTLAWMRSEGMVTG